MQAMMMRRWAMVLAGALALSMSDRAGANGRYPQAQRLVENPMDPNRLYLTATYGLLMTHDRGANWYYVCERAFALKFLEGDPTFEVLEDGALLGGIFETENRSNDCGCTWSTVLGQATTDIVIDVTIDRNGSLIALVRDDAAVTGRVALAASTDLGQTWYRLGDLPDGIVDAYTVDVAPSDPTRIYVSGFAGDSAKLVVSTDRGQSWDQRDIPGTTGDVRPFIAAIHPSDPDRVFLRMDKWDYEAEFAAQDGLFYSPDGGRTWSEILHRQAKLFGFALAPDGNTVLAGYGDPIEAGGRTTNGDDFGIYKASTTDFAFEKIFTAMVSCLRWTPTGVYVCTVQHPGMAMGFAANADFTLATPQPFTALLDLPNVRGPLACLASTCGETWTVGLQGTAPICQSLGAECGADLSRNNPSCPEAAGGVGGASGLGGSGGVDAGTSSDKRDGCGCHLGRDGAACRWISAYIVAGLLVLRRMRSSRNHSDAKR